MESPSYSYAPSSDRYSYEGTQPGPQHPEGAAYDLEALQYGRQFEDVLNIRTAVFRDEPPPQDEELHVPPTNIFHADKHLGELFQALRHKQEKQQVDVPHARELSSFDSRRVTVASSFQVGRFASNTFAAEQRNQATIRQVENAIADAKPYNNNGGVNAALLDTLRAKNGLPSTTASGADSPKNRPRSQESADCDCAVCKDMGGARAFVTPHLTRPTTATPAKQVAPTQSMKHKTGHHCPYHVELTGGEEEVESQFGAPVNHRMTLPLSDWLTGGKMGSVSHGDCGLFAVKVPRNVEDPWNFSAPKPVVPLPSDVHLLHSIPIISRTLNASIFCELGCADVTEKFTFGYSEDLRSLGAGHLVRFKFTMPPNAMLSGMTAVIGSGASKCSMELRPQPATQPGRQGSWKGKGSVRRRQAQQASEEEAKKRKQQASSRRSAESLDAEHRGNPSPKQYMRQSTGQVRFGAVSFAGNEAAPQATPRGGSAKPSGYGASASGRFTSNSVAGLRPSLQGAKGPSLISQASTGGASSIRFIPDGCVGDGPNTLSVDLGCLGLEATCSIEVKYIVLLDAFDNSIKFSHLANWVPPDEGHCTDVDSYPMNYHIHMVAQPDSIKFVDMGQWSGGIMGADMLPSVSKQTDQTTWWLMQRSIKQTRLAEPTSIIIDMKESVRTCVLQIMTQRVMGGPRTEEGKDVTPWNTLPSSPASTQAPRLPQEQRIAIIKARVKPMGGNAVEDGISTDGRPHLEGEARLLELWLLLDVSGSMAGKKMEAARVVALNFVKGIPLGRGIRFNMVAYRADCEVWSSEGSTEFTPVVREDALRSINELTAGGKASLLTCLQEMYTKDQYSIPDGYHRRVFLISDGGTTDSEAYDVYNVVRDRNSPTAMNTSFFCVGVGLLGGGELSQKLLKKMSKKSGGMFAGVEPSMDMWARCRLIQKAAFSTTLTLAPTLQLPDAGRYSQPPGQLPGLVRPGQHITMLVQINQSQPGDVLTLSMSERPGKSLKLYIPMAPSTPGPYPRTFRRTAWDGNEGGEATESRGSSAAGIDGELSETCGGGPPVGRIRSGSAFSQIHAMLLLSSMMQDLASYGAEDEAQQEERLELILEATESLAASHCLMTPMSHMIVEVKMPNMRTKLSDEYFNSIDTQNPHTHIVPYHVHRLPATRMTAGDPTEDAAEFGRLSRDTTESLVRMIRLSQRQRGAWLATPDLHLRATNHVLFNLVETFMPLGLSNAYHNTSHVELAVQALMRAKPTCLNNDLWVTVLVLAFLTKHLMSVYDLWQLLEANAWVWLRYQWPVFPQHPLYRPGDKVSSCRTLAVTQAARVTSTIGHCVLDAHQLIP